MSIPLLPRDTPIWKLQAALKCGSCQRQRRWPGLRGGAHHGHHGGSTAHGQFVLFRQRHSSGASSANDILQQFLQSLKDSLSASSPTSYGATGTFQTGSNSTASFSALLIDCQT
jgi:hypothetical protein